MTSLRPVRRPGKGVSAAGLRLRYGAREGVGRPG